MKKKKGKITELDLFLPVYKVAKLITEATQAFPKCYKDSLANSLINNMLFCLELLVNCNYGDEIQDDLRKKITYVSLLLRLCVDIKILSVGRFAEITLIIDEIKTLLGEPEDTTQFE